jgi:DNA repair exonuclease SbcCD ATPase subunit
MRASIKAEVEDVRESVVASELIPEDSLQAGSNKQESCGKLQEDSSVELQQSESNVGTTAAEKEPCVYCGQIPCDWLTFETEIAGNASNWRMRNATTKKSVTMPIAGTLGLGMEFFVNLIVDHYPYVYAGK